VKKHNTLVLVAEEMPLFIMEIKNKMKVHLTNIGASYLNVPTWLQKEMNESKTKHTACGYLRKQTTSNKDEVTCKLCLREMK